jgi:hypothetical protein
VHKTITAILRYAFLVMVILVVAWLLLGATVDEESYLKLARSGLLLVGLFTMAWGALTRSGHLVRMGLVALAIGWVSFYAGAFIQRLMYRW